MADGNRHRNAAATGNATGDEEIGHETDEPVKETTLPFSTSTAATHHHVLLLQRSQQTAQTLSVSVFPHTVFSVCSWERSPMSLC